MWHQTGRAHKDKGFSHSVNAEENQCLSLVGSPFGWLLWTISSLCKPSQSHPRMKQSENQTDHQYEYLPAWWAHCNTFFFLIGGEKRLSTKITEIHLSFYLAELIEVQNLSFYVREPNLRSLQLPKLCNLIQKVELNSSESLKSNREEKDFRNWWAPQAKGH